jgi:hypothetical protein
MKAVLRSRLLATVYILYGTYICLAYKNLFRTNVSCCYNKQFDMVIIPCVMYSYPHGIKRPAASSHILPLQPVHVGGLPSRRGERQAVGSDGTGHTTVLSQERSQTVGCVSASCTASHASAEGA